MKRELCATAAVVLLSSAPALAQSAPPSIPPSITNAVESILTKLGGDAVAPYGVDPNRSRGTVTYFKRFDLQLRMPLNAYRDVHLHQGTVINPRGATIEPGQVLDIVGRANGDGSLNADTITIIH